LAVPCGIALPVPSGGDPVSWAWELGAVLSFPNTVSSLSRGLSGEADVDDADG
jgi:hypothetical protein